MTHNLAGFSNHYNVADYLVTQDSGQGTQLIKSAFNFLQLYK